MRLQNGHWKSEKSTTVTGALAFPRTGSSLRTPRASGASSGAGGGGAASSTAAGAAAASARLASQIFS